MYILMVEAFGDFDCPYEIPVCCCANEHVLQLIRQTLNHYCAKHPKAGMDVKLIEDLKDADSGLYISLREAVSEDVADKIYAKLKEICSSSSVLIYDGIFEVQETLDI